MKTIYLKVLIFTVAITISCIGKSLAQVTDTAITIEQVTSENKDQKHQYREKYPIVAFALSAFVFPGLGQVYNGDVWEGVAYASGFVTSWIFLIYSAYTLTGLQYVNNASHYGGMSNTVAIFGIIGGLVGINVCWWGSWIAAARRAEAINKSHGLASWNIGKKANLALNPDVRFWNTLSPHQQTTSTCGLRVNINF